MFRLCSVLLILLSAPANAQTLTGPIRVIDADTFDIGAPSTMRLLGIDAAEDAQTCGGAGGAVVACGAMATDAARALYEGRQAVCTAHERDVYDRFLGTCRVDGRDVGADLVGRGLARRYRDDPRYAAEERAARAAGRGLWAYEMQDPAEWRADRRAERIEDFAPTGECAIKGNISGSGRIYHVPGSRSYDGTRIDEAAGERWFCTEGEALAAGWRAPRG